MRPPILSPLILRVSLSARILSPVLLLRETGKSAQTDSLNQHIWFKTQLNGSFKLVTGQRQVLWSV